VRTCYLTFRDDLHYRIAQFKQGFERIGYRVELGLPRRIDSSDVVCIWNRYGRFNVAAQMAERAGAKVLVCENGYLGKHWRGGVWFALAQAHHNGAGRWPNRGPERWDSWNVELAPYRERRSLPFLLLPQRGIGEPGVRMPPDWQERAEAFLRAARLPYRVRPHPGQGEGSGPVEIEAQATAGVVTWGSGAALKVMVAGVRAFTDFSEWIGASAAYHFEAMELRNWAALGDDRLAMFRRLAWALWEMREINSGEALCTVLES
jgi:hypothetical protein